MAQKSKKNMPAEEKILDGHKSVGNIQFLTDVNDRGRKTVQFHNLGISRAVTEVFPGKRPQAVVLDHLVDTENRLGFGLVNENEIIGVDPGVDSGFDRAVRLLRLFAEKDADLSAFLHGLTV